MVNDGIGCVCPKLVAGRCIVVFEEVGKQVVLRPDDGGSAGTNLVEHRCCARRVGARPPLGPCHVEDVDVAEMAHEIVVGGRHRAGYNPAGERPVQQLVVRMAMDRACDAESGSDTPAHRDSVGGLDLDLVHSRQLAPEAPPIAEAARIDGLHRSALDRDVDRAGLRFGDRDGEWPGQRR